jgi:hypothetical protein
VEISPLVLGTAAIFAGAIAAVSGFGIGSLLTPLLILTLPTAHAVALVAIPHAVATTIRWLGLRGDVHQATFRQFGIASAASPRRSTAACSAHCWCSWPSVSSLWHCNSRNVCAPR